MIPFTHWRAMDNEAGRCETSNPVGTKTVTFHRGTITTRQPAMNRRLPP
jgi:hypothetical protein